MIFDHNQITFLQLVGSSDQYCPDFPFVVSLELRWISYMFILILEGYSAFQKHEQIHKWNFFTFVLPIANKWKVSFDIHPLNAIWTMVFRTKQIRWINSL